MNFFKILPVFILGVFSSLSSVQATSASMPDTEVCKKFIEDTGNKIIQILVEKKTSLSERQNQFRQVIREKFDMPAIGRFVLGRHWKKADPAQQKEYLKLFEDSLVESYSHQFDTYTNEKLEIITARSSNKGGVIVSSKIIRATGGAPLQVDWKVFNTAKHGLRILDIIVNGVSMSITYRTEYANAYNSHGGTMEGLLSALRAKEITYEVSSE